MSSSYATETPLHGNRNGSAIPRRCYLSSHGFVMPHLCRSRPASTLPPSPPSDAILKLPGSSPEPRSHGGVFFVGALHSRSHVAAGTYRTPAVSPVPTQRCFLVAARPQPRLPRMARTWRSQMFHDKSRPSAHQAPCTDNAWFGEGSMAAPTVSCFGLQQTRRPPQKQPEATAAKEAEPAAGGLQRRRWHQGPRQRPQSRRRRGQRRQWQWSGRRQWGRLQWRRGRRRRGSHGEDVSRDCRDLGLGVGRLPSIRPGVLGVLVDNRHASQPDG